jgi:hypothetical protein
MKAKTPFPELNVVLEKLVSSVRGILGDNFVGAYLQGSAATGGFDEHSDCDFAIVINDELSDNQVQKLQKNHKRIFNMGLEWAKHLDGSYFPLATLWDYANSGSDLWYLNNGHSEMVRSDHCNSVVVRWILREKGVILTGPEPATLIKPVPPDTLRRFILDYINYWGPQILSNRQEYCNNFYQTYLVLQFCRMLHDLHAGTANSKRCGAEWAKQNLDGSWADLIDRTWVGRPNPAVSVRQPADPIDFERTMELIELVMRQANEYGEIAGLRTSDGD